MIKKTRTKKAYSLVELLVTMAIFGIIIVMLLHSLLLNIKLNMQINLRNKFNSELDQLVSLVERDIRNADFFYQDDNTPTSGVRGCKYVADPVKNNDCSLQMNGHIVTWYLDETTNTIRRTETLQPDYTSSSILSASQFEFFVNTSELDSLDNYSKANILLTIKVGPSNIEWKNNYGLMDQIRQLSVSTRNYEVKF